MARKARRLQAWWTFFLGPAETNPLLWSTWRPALDGKPACRRAAVAQGAWRPGNLSGPTRDGQSCYPGRVMSGEPVGLSVLVRGLALGFAIAAPVGPIGVLCLRRTLAEGWAVGLASGLGAATADGLYAAVAAFGVTAISGLVLGQQTWVKLVGGAFLCYLGTRAFCARPTERAARPAGKGLLSAYGSMLFLTLSNPPTILIYAALFAGFGAAGGGDGVGSAALLVAGVCLGSALWWLLLSGGVAALRTRFSPRAFQWVNRGSGLVIAAFGVAALWSLAG